MPARPRWFDHIEPATALVACSGERHRVTWRHGKVKLEDHDLDAERTMLAFGGEAPACLQALQLWRNLHTWAMSAELFRQMQSRLGPGGLLVPGDLRRVHELGLLLTWERAWRRTAYFSEHERLLHEQLRSRVLSPLRQHLRHWMTRHGCRRISSMEVRVARRGQPAGLRGEMDTVSVRATATLGPAWIIDVWTRGITVVDGAFVVEVTGREREGEGTLAIRAIRWVPRRPGLLVPEAADARVRRRPEGGWALAWPS